MWRLSQSLAFHTARVEVKLGVHGVTTAMMDDSFTAKPHNEVRARDESVESSVGPEVTDEVF